MIEFASSKKYSNREVKDLLKSVKKFLRIVSVNCEVIPDPRVHQRCHKGFDDAVG